MLSSAGLQPDARWEIPEDWTGKVNTKQRAANGGVEHEPAVLLFDGVCGLCNRLVDLLIVRDRRRVLRYAPLQSEAGQRLLRERGADPTDLSSVVLIAGRKAIRRSDAVLDTLSLIGGWWRVLAVTGRAVPRPLRNVIYDAVARRRYRWFGTRETCRIATENERQQFLND